MRRLRVLGPLLVVAALASAAPASAAPPTPQDDSLAASPTGALDVLANDSGDPSGQLRVGGATQPSHGTVDCAPLGGCLYTATGGYTGADSFTYRARNSGGEETTATVTVNVTAPTGTAVPQARDDDTATPAGHAVTVDVLANDQPSGVTVTANGTGQHGSASCTPGGRCTYTPADGYAGTDGFTYRITDAAGKTSDAAVHVIVAPGDAAFRLGVAGRPRNPVEGAVPAGGLADWFAGVAAIPAGISNEALHALDPPSFTVAPGGPHAIAGTPATAAGWTASPSGAVKPTSNALLGESSTRTFPRPLPPISQGSGGDGHVPILVGTKVFAFFHHSFPTQVTCVDRATGEVCPGYPKQLNMGTSNIPGPGAVDGSRIYVHLLPATGYAETAPIALFCWDAATDATCGLTVVARLASTGNPGASAPVVAGGKVWLGGDTGALYCVEPTTGAPCATPSLPTGLDAAASPALYDRVSHGSRVFLSRSDGAAACVDVSAGTTCPGWATPKSFGPDFWNLVTQHDGTGAATGACLFRVATSPNQGACVPDADPANPVVVTNFVASEPYSQAYSVTQEGEAGSRTLVPSLSRSGLGCYDWATMAPCTGGGYAADGWLAQDGKGGSLPSAYGAVFDGACVVALGDPGQIFTVDPAGASPCLSLSSGADRVGIDLRDQRCDGTVGTAAFKAVRLTDAKAGELDFVRVTVRDAKTGEVLANGDLVASGGTLDLSGIDASRHPSITVDATAKSSGAGGSSTPWSDGIPPRLTIDWTGDPAALCLATRGEDHCSAAALTPITLLGSLTAPSQGTSEGKLQLRRGGCPSAVLGVTKAKPQPVSRCGSRRSFVIHVRVKGRDVRSIVVVVGKRKQKVLTLKPRPVVRIVLKGKRRSRVHISITVRTKSGKKLHGTRTYNPCTRKRLGKGFTL